MNLVYNHWDRIQKMQFLFFGINKDSTFIENRNTENDTNMISAIFSIKFPLQSNFSKYMNSFISAVILILCVIKINNLINFIFSELIHFLYLHYY